jgi:hypothetical protein
MLITANQPFGEWDRIFPDQAMTLAAVDRLVHHATIFEMQRRKLPTTSGDRSKNPAWTATNSRTNQNPLTDVQQHQKVPALLSRRVNLRFAATALFSPD